MFPFPAANAISQRHFKFDKEDGKPGTGKELSLKVKANACNLSVVELQHAFNRAAFIVGKYSGCWHILSNCIHIQTFIDSTLHAWALLGTNACIGTKQTDKDRRTDRDKQ